MSSFFVILLLHVLHTQIFSCSLLDDDEEHYQSLCKSITSRFCKRLYPICLGSCLIDSISLAFADKSIPRKYCYVTPSFVESCYRRTKRCDPNNRLCFFVSQFCCENSAR